MLPQLTPRVTISANTGSGLRGHSASSSARPSDGRGRHRRPPIASGTCAATLAQPTRKSLDGIKKSLDSTSALREQLVEDPLVASSSSVASIPHSVSAASLSSEGDLALLLGSGNDQAGSTPLVFGSFPPVAVQLPSSDTAAGEEDATTASGSTAPAAAPASTDSSSRGASKLKPDSHEFYPPAYLAAAAATALAARTISNAALNSTSSPAKEDCATQASAPEEGATATAPALEGEHAAHSEGAAAPEATYMPAAAPPAEPQQQVVAQHQPQQYWAADPAQWQQHQPLTEQQWQQQQQWQHWAAAQQQQHAQQHPMMPMPVLVPVFVQPYPYPHYMQQQPQMHYMMLPADPAAAAAATTPAAHQQAPQQHMQALACPPSPGGYSLPADTCSLMSASAAATPAATPTAWQHNAHYGSSRPGSSAGSVVSGYSTASRRHQRQQQYGDAAGRESGTVTVSAASCVKDAAGALAKVVTRHGNCLLLSLVKPADAVAQATHVAAKSLAVARFYVNAHMAAAGAAGIDAAAALTGADSAAAAAGGSSGSSSAGSAGAAAADDEVVFMPYHRSSSGSSSRQGLDASEVPLGFVVAKASARDLPVLLPPPVGIPACMQDKLQQQQGQQQRAAGAASGSSGASSTALLKAGANTDVNKLSNAVIHNILGSGHVAMQLAGAAACHVAMRSLIKARDRLLRKFNTDIVATASFANEDTSSSIGRSTVFLRLDVMRSNLLQQVAAAGSAVMQAVEGQAQQHPAVATA